jgi:hypothetical protein
MSVDSAARKGSALGALTGLAGAVVYVIGALLPGIAPKPDATTSAVAAFLAHNRSTLLTGFALELIAVGLMVWFVGYLYLAIADASPPQPVLAMSMVAAFVITIAVAAAGTVPVVAIVWRGAAAPSLIRFAYDIQTIATYVATATVAAVSVAAPSVAIWRTNILPRWLCVLGAVEIAVNVAELVGLASRHGTFAGGYAGGAGPLLWLGWFAAASVCMALRARTAAKPAR